MTAPDSLQHKKLSASCAFYFWLNQKCVGSGCLSIIFACSGLADLVGRETFCEEAKSASGDFFLLVFLHIIYLHSAR